MRFWNEICAGRRLLADSGTDGRISITDFKEAECEDVAWVQVQL